MQNNRQRLKATPYHAHHLDRLSKPYFWWLYIFACFPVLIMVFLMFVDTEGIRLDEMEFTMYNFTLLSNQSVLIAFYNSLKYSLLTTLLCIFFGYLLAYTLFKSNLKNKYLILLLLILPMWTNILLRITALANIFKPNNILTDLLGIPGLNIIGTDWAILLGMVFTYLPFIVLPIYTSLEKNRSVVRRSGQRFGSNRFYEILESDCAVVVKGCLFRLFDGFSAVFIRFCHPESLGRRKNFIDREYHRTKLYQYELQLRCGFGGSHPDHYFRGDCRHQQNR